MIPASSIVAVRRTRIANFFALWLILLTVLPFTAPFSTCDDAELTGEVSVLDKHPCAKSTSDPADACVVASIGLPAALLVALVYEIEPVTHPDRLARLTVLRI